MKGDERILGDSNFVLHVLNEQNERMERRYRLREQGYDIENVIERVSKLFSLSKQDIVNPSRQRQRVMARSEFFRDVEFYKSPINSSVSINRAFLIRDFGGFYLFHCPYWTVQELGMSGAELSQMLGMGQSSVSRALGRGEKLVNDMKLTLL